MLYDRNESLKPHIVDKEQDNILATYLFAIWNSKTNIINNYPNIYPKTGDMWHLNEILTMGAILFIIGHEFGHVLSKDNGYTTSQAVNYQKEYNADSFGLEIVYRYMLMHGVFSLDNYEIMFSLFSVYLALSSIALFNPNCSDTHPSIFMRLKKITENFKKLLSKNNDVDYQKLSKELCDKNDIVAHLDQINNKFLKNCSRINCLIKELECKYGKTKPSDEFLKKFNFSYN